MLPDQSIITCNPGSVNRTYLPQVYCFTIFWLWVLMMNVIPETHWMRYLRYIYMTQSVKGPGWLNEKPSQSRGPGGSMKNPVSQGARLAKWVRSLHLPAHTSLSPIRRGFAPSFVNYQKRVHSTRSRKW